MLHVLFSVYLKMLVLYSPFFVLSCFISLTRGYSSKERRRLAWKVALATLVSSVLLYLFGRVIFSVFGITVDAFRIGAGSVLFISALGMAQGKSAVQTDNVQQDVTIVPLTIPLTVRPLPARETRSKRLRSGSHPRLTITLINSSYHASLPRWTFSTSLT